MKVSDDDVLINLSRLGLLYHIELLELESAPTFKKHENRLFVLLVDEMLNEVVVVVSDHFLDDFDEGFGFFDVFDLFFEVEV